MGENRRQGSNLSSGGQFWAVLSFWNLELVGEGRVYVYPEPDWQFLEIKELVPTLTKIIDLV
jgi:hypothetical protein